MITTTVYPKTLKGKVTAPPSKSVLHRAVICACLSEDKCFITNARLSADIDATLNAMKALGRYAKYKDGQITAGGSITLNGNITVDCCESGSTLRFLIPVAGAMGMDTVFTGQGRLPERPLNEFTYLLSNHGMDFNQLGEHNLPLSVSGRLISGTYKIKGDISSQYITGLLLSLPLLAGDSEIILKTPLESKGYVDLTLDILKHYGIEIQHTETGYHIKGFQKYKAYNYCAEGDYSSAAFYLCAGALGSDIIVSGLNMSSKQGDREVVEILKRFGAEVTVDADTVTVRSRELYGIEIDASQIPDLVPILAVVGAYANGTTVIKNAARLRLKESDRLFAMAKNLKNIGADIDEKSDSLIIRGKNTLKGGEADGFNDHRIVMAMSIAALRTENGIEITGAESISKSYPDFYKDFENLGGLIK